MSGSGGDHFGDARLPRQLIINADDFGLSEGVNAGIIEAHERGIVTACSLMVRWPAAAAAARYAKARASLDVGLHLDLGEWNVRDGQWQPLYEVVALHDAAAVAAEVKKQFEAFRRLTGREPSHVDSHQHTHSDEPARSIVSAIARELQIPVRHLTQGIRYWGQFYGQSDSGESFPELVSVDALLGLVAELPRGITELGCHPGRGRDINSMYIPEREVEVQTLCDPRVRAGIMQAGIQLCAFADYRPTT
jgi:chitin disaccharide deacetylase